MKGSSVAKLFMAAAAVVVACGGPGPAGEGPSPTASRDLSSSDPRPQGTIDPRPVVSPASVTLRVGQTQQFAAARQEAGTSFGPPIRATWSVSPPTLGTITADGLFTAREPGSGTVTATQSAFSGTASVRVDPSP